MSGNSFGKLLKITSFGESHGSAIGGVIDGFPAGIKVDLELIQHELDKRRPGQSEYVTSRNESDRIEILSGIIDGKSLGSSIGFIIRNKDSQSKDYNHLKDVFRPSHADYTYEKKYLNAPYLWGGRSIFGIDCSGFIQIVFKMAGIMLPRDSSQQIEKGEIINFLEEARQGDLAFFEDEEGTIIHVGILIDNQTIIHASGKVRIDKIDHNGIYNKELQKYTHKLRLVKRIIE